MKAFSEAMRPSMMVMEEISYREWEMNNQMSPLLNAAGRSSGASID